MKKIYSHIILLLVICYSIFSLVAHLLKIGTGQKQSHVHLLEQVKLRLLLLTKEAVVYMSLLRNGMIVYVYLHS